MTECPKCKGYGIIGSAVPDILRGRGAIFSSNECDMCNGTGEVNMTNEEWFCQLSTEEKAKTIICLAVNSMHKWKKGLIDSDVGEIVRWLKAEHDSEEK